MTDDRIKQQNGNATVKDEEATSKLYARVVNLVEELESACRAGKPTAILGVLKRLSSHAMDVETLRQTGVGRAVNDQSLRKHSNMTIREQSQRLVKQWKGMHKASVAKASTASGGPSSGSGTSASGSQSAWPRQEFSKGNIRRWMKPGSYWESTQAKSLLSASSESSSSSSSKQQNNLFCLGRPAKQRKVISDLDVSEGENKRSLNAEEIVVID